MNFRIILISILINYLSYTTLKAADSQGFRGGSKGAVLLGTGAHLGLGSDTGAEFIYVHSKELQFNLFYWSASSDIDLSDPPVEAKASINGSLIGLNGRYFPGNSFFIEGGFGYRNIGFDYELNESTTNTKVSGDLTANAVTINAAIGNQWVLGPGIVLNFNWIGANFPISSSSKTNSKIEGALAENLSQALSDSDAEFEDLSVATSKSSSPIISASIGWMF